MQKSFFLRRLKRRAKTSPRNQTGEICFNGWKVKHNDMPSFYTEYKNIFFHQIYRFQAETSTPSIIDGGGGIGMAILYFKSIYPDASIVCFEPDERVFNILQENVTTNGLNKVKLVQAGLANKTGTVSFFPDNADGGKIVEGQESEFLIKTVCLSDYLTAPVDFLKLNVEGQEFPVLSELEYSGKLNHVKELVLEYHGWADDEQRLGAILDLLDRNGFRYFVHDFDAETCPTSKPPFRWTPEAIWYCLVYARRISQKSV